MLTVYDLTRNQLDELKAIYLDQHLQETCDECASYGEITSASEIVPDWLIFDTYAGTLFSPGDFFCGEEVTPLDYPVYFGSSDHDYLGDGEKILTAPCGRDTINTQKLGGCAMKPYYFPNSGYVDVIFGGQSPVCMDRAEVDRLSREDGGWENIWEQVHEASAAEIEEFGVYDS